MSGRKPTLGYPSRTEAVLALRAEGLSDRAIADRVGIEPKTVAALEASAARARITVHSHRTIVFPLATLRQLYSPAIKRGVSVNELARRIVETVVDEGIIDAVLDDGDAA